MNLHRADVMTPPDPAFVEIVLPIGMAGTLVVGGAAYGITKQKVDSAHRRIDELALHRLEHTKAMDRKLDRIEKTLTDLSVALARISPNAHTHQRRDDERDHDG